MKTRAIAILSLFVSTLGGCAAETSDGAEPESETSQELSSFEYDEAVRGVPSGSCTAEIRKYWGRGCYVENGDKIFVQDSMSDGESVAIRWSSGGRQGLCRSVLGAGVPGYCNKNLAEGHFITIWIGHCNKTATRTCRKDKDYYWAYAERTTS